MSYLRRVERQKEQNRRREERRRRMRERAVARAADGPGPRRHGLLSLPVFDESGKEFRARATVCANCRKAVEPRLSESGAAVYDGHVVGSCASPEPAAVEMAGEPIGEQMESDSAKGGPDGRR